MFKVCKEKRPCSAVELLLLILKTIKKLVKRTFYQHITTSDETSIYPLKKYEQGYTLNFNPDCSL